MVKWKPDALSGLPLLPQQHNCLFCSVFLGIGVWRMHCMAEPWMLCKANVETKLMRKRVQDWNITSAKEKQQKQKTKMIGTYNRKKRECN